MKFTYILNGIGWADVHFEINKKTLYFEPSYLTEPLVDLVEGLLNIIPGCVPDDELREFSVFEWNSEPRGWVWKLSLLGEKKLKVYIESYPDLYSKNEMPTVELDTVCDIEEFVKEVVNSLEVMIRKYGFVGYRQTWFTYQDFPISGYFRLKHYLEHGATYPTIDVKEDGYIEYKQSNLEDELRILLKLIEKD